MHVKITDTMGNANIGLFAYSTDSCTLLGPQASSLQADIEAVLGTRVIQCSFAGTSLLGVFLTGNSSVLLVPSILFAHEQEVLSQLGLRIIVFDTLHTALGNTIVMNDSGVVVGPMFSSDEIAFLAKETGLPVVQTGLAQTEVVGSGVVHTQRGMLVHRDSSLEEQEVLSQTLGINRVLPGTVNLGSPFVRGGIIANNKGFLIGSQSGGPEVTNADEALGFLGDV